MLRVLRVLPVVLPVVLLAGCGVAGTQFHPGIAAQVGDQTITTRHVDEVSDGYCKAVEKVNKGQQTAEDQRPMRFLTHAFATDLIVRAAAEQLADDYDVKPTAAYKDQLAQLEPQLTTLSEGQKDAVREIFGAQAYAQDVLTQIGELSLKKQGTTDSTDDDQLAEGQKLLDQWVADHDVEINPKYGIEVGKTTQVDTDLSYPLSATARGGALGPADGNAAADPDDTKLRADYVAALPGQLVCLD